MIAGIYGQGHLSRAHYVRRKDDLSQTWSHVPKNKPSKRIKRINKWVHMYECVHGHSPITNALELCK